MSKPLRPKARGLVQNGGPTGWLEERDLAGVVLCVMDGPYSLPFPYRTGRLTGAAQLRVLLSLLNCELPRIPLLL